MMKQKHSIEVTRRRSVMKSSVVQAHAKYFIRMGVAILVLMPVMISGVRLSRRNSFDQVSHKGVFIQLPFLSPPTVRPPPYADSYEQCPEINHRENWVDTLCGDLNKGSVPLNPFNHKFEEGSSYPFEIIKNKTLQFFRHALPVLRNDKSLPKVARYTPLEAQSHRHHQYKRSLTPGNEVMENDAVPSGGTRSSEEDASQPRGRRGNWQKQLTASANRFCENVQPKGNLICNLYNAMWGKPNALKQNMAQVLQQNQHQEVHRNAQYSKQPFNHHPQRTQEHHKFAESKHGMSVSAENIGGTTTPDTPCPSSAEYLTPVFARNHEGAWRYVVQIPREGYFTQTVEVTKCAETNCFFMEGSCRTSPRWQSLLVAEMFYPEASFPVTLNSAKITPNQYHQTLKRAGEERNEVLQGQTSKVPSECDGVDEIGCFQVRLFYDWFLIPGSCKCWKRKVDFTRVHQSR